MKMISGSIIALVGIGCCCLSLYFLWLEVLLDVTGQSTTGVVMQLDTSEDEDHNTTYYLTYRYEDNRERSHTSRSDVGKTLFATHARGDSIPVVYAANFPEISRVRPAGEWLWLVGILALFGGVSVWFGLRMVRRQIFQDKKLARLTTKGQRLIGRLVAVEDDKTQPGEDPPQVLVYVFTDQTGQERIGTSFPVKARDQEFWKGRIGSALDIRVNPADPDDHIALVKESKLLGLASGEAKT